MVLFFGERSLNQPFFKKLVVGGGNLLEEKVFIFQDYREYKLDGDGLFWMSLTKTAVSAVFVAVFFAFCIFLARLSFSFG